MFLQMPHDKLIALYSYSEGKILWKSFIVVFENMLRM